MKINIYYGGRGLIEDPTIYVMNKLTEVLEELRVEVRRYNLYEEKNGLTVLPNTLKDVDGVILAASLEWLGIGGYMTQFLDACWLYGNKEKIGTLFMLPVVMSTAFGERDAQYLLIRAWEMLGGKTLEGLCAYVEDHVEFETNLGYANKIEKGAEALYRAINQKAKVFPSSFQAVGRTAVKSATIELTPQESEQLSVYVSDDTYVKKQKQDIEELAQIFKGMLGDAEPEEKYTSELKDHFHPLKDFSAIYEVQFTDMDKALVVDIQKNQLKCFYGMGSKPDVVIKTTSKVMDEVVAGVKTFQSAFMSGDLTAQGNFKILRTFDAVFQFQKAGS